MPITGRTVEKAIVRALRKADVDPRRTTRLSLLLVREGALPRKRPSVAQTASSTADPVGSYGADSVTKGWNSFRAAKARRRGQRPFHLDDRELLSYDTSWKGRRVELLRGKRARRYRCDRYFEVRYEIKKLQKRFGPWMKIIAQVPSRNAAEKVFRDCLDDITTGEP